MGKEKVVLNSHDELVEFFKNIDRDSFLNDKGVVLIENFEFNFDIILPFKLKVQGGLSDINRYFRSSKNKFMSCAFTKDVTVIDCGFEMFFESNCVFEKEVKIISRSTNLSFKNSKINRLNLEGATFGGAGKEGGKLRLKKCEVGFSNFKNAKFYSIVDFYNTTFLENVIFNKTDFLNLVILSATTFKKNALFTYTLLDDKVIMRNTVFEKGLDLSLAIIKGDLALFDIKLSSKPYKVIADILSEDEYEDSVANTGEIPIHNKQETFRLLKMYFAIVHNVPESLKYKRLEKETYQVNLRNKEGTIENLLERFNLWLNEFSSKHSTSYGRAFVFTIVIGWLFFYFSLISTKSFEFSLIPTRWALSEGAKYFAQFMIPTHSFKYMDDNVVLSNSFYIFDFIGRLFVGYGVFQFIQAFRKYK
ncbi:hypothetical protein [Dokdonia donghaensis]|uniref:Pentapeptide repeat-containing protein n=1 Tax=Dokdonia donghaensis DSW-1 TaxID=1300343 RepID=A0A0A2GZR4_9FLAO|nr:hypothetical protein [Dokdonia donghaensis]ANH60862.1 hypothetical protein I597_1964 [Dokdonia donghaensis DSW-1]KGO05885.1 hypothetical protein NV36_02835 [Dokdonia donghaensis DSW-1]